MTTITLNVPDEMAGQLGALQDRLPALLYEVLKSKPSQRNASAIPSGATHPAYREVFEFLASGPSPRQIIAHRPSAALQQRVTELLEKNREAELSEEESAELDGYEQAEDLLGMLKARAHLVTP
jgi:ABC-type cobalamin/Fe3+-siderophores transport system ATPase subunit